MLKIKKYVDLKDLEKFGFKKSLYYEDDYVKKVYLSNADDDKNFYRINSKTREIRLTRIDGELDSTIYDLVKADVVEKVEELKC